MSLLVGGILITFSCYLNVKFLVVKQVIVFDNIIAFTDFSYQIFFEVGPLVLILGGRATSS